MDKINILALIFRYHRFKVLLLLITVVVILNTVLYTHVYSVYDVIRDDDIVNHLVAQYVGEPDHLCPLPDLKRVDLLKPLLNVTEESSNWTPALNLLEGGEWQPLHCTSRYLVAIVVPYRNREEHLKVFLRNIHPFLQQQNIHYKIYVVEQEDEKEFNRGKLFNVGFVEARKEKPFSCFIFHDVDLIPLNLNNVYACTNLPRHMSSSIDKFRYEVPYDCNFGGVLSILSHQYQAVNGFSNLFYGWGGEDDDFFNRIRHARMGLLRFTQYVARYQSLVHEPAQPSDVRFERLESGLGEFSQDGLNSLQYHLKATIDTPTHVRIVVEL